MSSSTSNTSNIENIALRDVASERRQAMRVVRYWEHLRGERPMPVEDDLDIDHQDIQELWDHCFVVQLRDIETGRSEYNYTHLGAKIINAYSQELEGMDVDGMVSLNASKLINGYKEVVETVRPVMHSGEYDDGTGRIMKYRQCLLPLGKDKVEVILGHLNYQFLS